MTKLDQVKEKIIKAVPEIMELKFGCYFKYKDEQESEFIYHVLQNHPFWFEAKTNNTCGKYLPYNKADIEIIGRPITLEDVLIAFTDIRLPTLEIGSPSGAPKIGLAFVLIRLYGKKGMCQWQLGKPLDQQSPELIEFLLNNL